MTNGIRLWLTLAFLLCVKVISAQQYFFTNYSTDHGLSNPIVSCIAKDHDGFLWIGTEAGLNRFNGYEFTVYKSLASDSSTLPSNVIRHLLVSNSGSLWVASSTGICVFEKKKNNFRRLLSVTFEGAKTYSVEYTNLFQDSKGYIWATTLGLGLMKYNPESDNFQQMIATGTLYGNYYMTSVIEDNDGILWASSYSHLYRFNPADNTVTEFPNQLHLQSNITFQAMGVYLDNSDINSLWIATWGDGLVHFNKHSGKFTSYQFNPDGLKNVDNIIFDLHHREKNKLWLATNRGIVEFDAVQKKYGNFIRDLINENPIINTETYFILKDNENIIWMGTNLGLTNINPAKQNFVSEPLWIKAPVPEFYYDEQSDKIYGIRFYNKRSLIIYDRKTNAQTTYAIPNADELRAEPFCIIKDNDGLIWIGTTKGIYSFDEQKKKFTLLKAEEKLQVPDRSLYGRSVLKDDNGNIWFACYSKGLLKIDTRKWIYKKYFYNEQVKNGFPLRAINKILEDKSKIIYACDDVMGIVKLNPENETWEYYNSDDNKYAALKGASDMTVDSDQRVWVSTKNNGLVCIDANNEVTTYVKDDFGQLVDEQKSIVQDRSGKMWIPANTGIFCFDPVSESFSKFTHEDGFPVRTLDTPFKTLSNGKLLYRYNKGIFVFDPLLVSKSGYPLQVHLNSLSVNGEISTLSNSIDVIDTLKLSHKENNLTFEFAATDFTNAASTVYSYMLEGIDKTWSSPTRTRNVNFSQLSPGDYTLRIKTRENSPEKKLFIQIIPGWWQTVWFKWFVVIFIIIILFYTIRFYLSIRFRQRILQLERLREIEGIRMRISRDIHDEIGSGLTKIKLMSRNLSRASTYSDAIKETSKISSASDELIQNLSEIVWTVNPTNDSLENVFAYTRNYLSKLFEENSDVKLQLDFTEPAKIPHGILLNPGVKRNLLLILKEAMTNTFKHANASEVKIRFQADKSNIVMNIKDNGKGISLDCQNGFGNGLKNMRKRAESINAEFYIESTNGGGTEIHLMIPLNKL